jgi:hypothetical protein
MVVILGYALVVALGWLSPGQAAERRPVQGVSIEAKDLTPAEMAQVRRLARPTGRQPWLIHGFRYGLGAKSTPRRMQLGIYLQPDVENGGLRRGRMLLLEISAPAGAGQTPSLRIESTAKYAQLVVPGRRPDDVKGKWDLHRPFLVDGEFDDQTLVSLVTLIRRSPEGPAPPNGESPARVNGSLAISDVRRTSSGVEVRLSADAYHGQYVTLEERNGRLVFVKHGVWVV